MALPRLYTPEQVADALGVSAWWVREQARKGAITGTRVGGAWRFTEQAVTALVQERTQPARPQTADTAPLRRTTPAEAGTRAPVVQLVARPPRARRKKAG